MRSWEVFQALSNVCGQGQSEKVLQLSRLEPSPQKLDLAAKGCQEQRLELIAKVNKLRTKKLKKGPKS